MPSPKSGTLANLVEPLPPKNAVEAIGDMAGGAESPQPREKKAPPIKLGRVKVKPRSPVTVSAATVTSDKPCGIAKLEVACEHNRKPGAGGVLQVVADTHKSLKATIDGGIIQFSLTSEWQGTDTVTAKAKPNDPKAGGQMKTSLNRTGSAPDDGQWKDEAQQVFSLQSPNEQPGQWLISQPPERYFIFGRGCDRATQCVTIESFCNATYTATLEPGSMVEWIDSFQETLEKWCKELCALSPVYPDGGIDTPSGKLEAIWGWKEDADWQAYYGITVEGGFDPLFGIHGSLETSFGKMILAGCGIPPCLASLATHILGDILLTLKVGVSCKLMAGIYANFYSDGHSKIGPVANAEITGTGEIDLSIIYGSDIFGGIAITGSATTTVTGGGELSAEYEGVFLSLTVDWEPLTLAVEVQFKSFFYSPTIGKGEWKMWPKETLWSMDKTRLFPRQPSLSKGVSGGW